MTNSAFLQMINFADSSVVPHCSQDKTLIFLHDILGFYALALLVCPSSPTPQPSLWPPCSAITRHVCCSATLCHPLVPLFTLSGMLCFLFGSMCLLCLCDSTLFIQQTLSCSLGYCGYSSDQDWVPTVTWWRMQWGLLYTHCVVCSYLGACFSLDCELSEGRNCLFVWLSISHMKVRLLVSFQGLFW